MKPSVVFLSLSAVHQRNITSQYSIFNIFTEARRYDVMSGRVEFTGLVLVTRDAFMCHVLQGRAYSHPLGWRQRSKRRASGDEGRVPTHGSSQVLFRVEQMVLLT